jgi:ornithine--oxo-acid transaminase
MGYEVKGIPEKLKLLFVKIIFMEEQQRLFHFQMMKMHVRIWTFTEGFIKIAYDDTDALEAALKSNVNIAGFLVEPIQGEAFMYLLKAIWRKLKRFVQLIMCYLLLTKCRQGSHVLEDC